MKKIFFRLTALSPLLFCSNVADAVPPFRLEAGTMLCDTLPEAVESVDWHLRLNAAKIRRTHCRIIWNADTAMNNFRFCDIEIPEEMEQDDGFPVMPRYILGAHAEGNEVRTANGKFHTTYPSGEAAALSIRLRADARGAAIECGGSKADGIIEIDFRTDPAGIISASVDRPTNILRHSLRAESRHPSRNAPFSDADGLTAYMKESSDPVEGIWDYLDRDIDPVRCTLGAFYRLATVSTGNGNYEIYSIDKKGKTAPVYKGLLIPSIFMNHYDLQWLDARGHMLTTDTSAGIENGSVLTLSFRLLKSSVRFSRMRLKD